MHEPVHALYWYLIVLQLLQLGSWRETRFPTPVLWAWRQHPSTLQGPRDLGSLRHLYLTQGAELLTHAR